MFQTFFKALEDFNRFFAEENRESRKLVFYSEKGIYLRYYEGLIRQILAESDLEICYLTADIADPIFKWQEPRIKPFFINNYEATIFPKLDSKVVVMTLPDLNRFYIKKTTNPGVNHIYLFHAIGSTHMQYNFGALDYYDTVFCVGSHHEAEIRRAESLYNLPPKQLVHFGYPYLEKIYQDHQSYQNSGHTPETAAKTVLIAPTWGKTCIIETCILELVKALQDPAFQVVVRPHPEYVKRRGKMVERLKKDLKPFANTRLELDLVSGTNVHNADVLITDWSGIGFEFAFGTERPVLFVDTPSKVDNPRYEELGIEPLEIFSRNRIGRSVKLAEVGQAGELVRSFITDYQQYRREIVEFREQYLYNWMNSAPVGARYIIEQCR